jgi:predicted molibdopterin-dependent oxidoreductase YjgC
MPDDEYPLVLTTERSLYHFHTATMTRKVGGLNVLRERELVEINPVDAANLGIENGEIVRVVSRRGAVNAEAMITDACLPGLVSMTFHFAESPTNILTSPAIDPVAKIPETKVCAIRVEKIGQPEQELIGVLERASRDNQFVAMLAKEGSQALEGYNLTSAQRAALVSGDIRWIEDHIGELEEHQKRWLRSRLEQETW